MRKSLPDTGRCSAEREQRGDDRTRRMNHGLQCVSSKSSTCELMPFISAAWRMSSRSRRPSTEAWAGRRRAPVRRWRCPSSRDASRRARSRSSSGACGTPLCAPQAAARHVAGIMYRAMPRVTSWRTSVTESCPVPSVSEEAPTIGLVKPASDRVPRKSRRSRCCMARLYAANRSRPSPVTTCRHCFMLRHPVGRLLVCARRGNRHV